MNREVQLHELARLLQAREWRAPCPTWSQRRLENLEEALSAERHQLPLQHPPQRHGYPDLLQPGGKRRLEDHVHAVKQTELTVAQNSGVAGND